jgi:hypothetical protein
MSPDEAGFGSRKAPHARKQKHKPQEMRPGRVEHPAPVPCPSMLAPGVGVQLPAIKKLAGDWVKRVRPNHGT